MALSKLELKELKQVFEELTEHMNNDDVGILWDFEYAFEEALLMINRELNEQN